MAVLGGGAGNRPRPRARRAGRPGGAMAARAAPHRRPPALRPRARRGAARMTYEEARAQFPVFERWAYMNAGTMGPLSRATLTAMDEQLRHDQERGRGGGDWFASVIALREQVRAQLAALLGTTPERVALTISTTDGCNIVLSALYLT